MAIMKASSVSPNGISLDGSSNIVISWKDTGDRHVKFEIKIFKSSDNTLVLDTNQIISYNCFYSIGANTLTNGITYKYQIYLWNANGDVSTSDWIIFKCSSIPTASLTNLSATIQNSSYVFTGSYSQSESVSLKSWQMLLYNQYSEIIGNSGLQYSTTISYEFAGLINNNTYSIELQVCSQDNLLSTTGKQSFSVSYETPKSAIALEAITIKEKAALQLRWNVKQILGISNSNTYINNEKLDLTNGKKVYFDDGFNISNDFTTKLWVESIVNYNFDINTNMNMISYNIAPTDTTAFWIDNSNQTTSLPMCAVISATSPLSQNVLWIEDETYSIAKQLKIVADVYEPTDKENTLWIDLGSSIGDILEIYKMKNESGDFIAVRYFNNKFHLYKNDALITSVAVSGAKYYLYIQQIGENLTLHAEVIL